MLIHANTTNGLPVPRHFKLISYTCQSQHSSLSIYLLVVSIIYETLPREGRQNLFAYVLTFSKTKQQFRLLQLQSTSLMKHCYLCMSIKYLSNSQIASKGLEQGLENIYRPWHVSPTTKHCPMFSFICLLPKQNHYLNVCQAPPIIRDRLLTESFSDKFTSALNHLT